MAERCVLILSAVLTCCACPVRAEGPPVGGGRSWPELTQKPYESLPTPDIGLKPLLLDPDGRAITTKDAWERQRRALTAAWLERLGRPPAKPEKLDVKEESRDVEPDHVRRLVSFASEGGRPHRPVRPPRRLCLP
jgi:hypothetical protein